MIESRRQRGVASELAATENEPFPKPETKAETLSTRTNHAVRKKWP